MNKFFKRFAGFSLGPFLGAAISFFTTPLLTYFIAPAEYGKSATFTVIQTIILSFIFFGMDQSYTREYHEAEDKKNLFQNALAVPMAIAVLFNLYLIFFNDQFSVVLFGEPGYFWATMSFGLLIIFSVLERFVLLSIRMEERAIEYSMFNIVMKLGILVAAVIMIALGFRNFLTVIYSTIIGQIVSDIVLLARYTELLDVRGFKIDWSLIKKMLIFGLPLMVASTMSSILNGLDRLFLRLYSTDYESGIYFATLKVASVIGIVKTAFTSFWVPTAYRWYAENKSIKHYKYISDVVLFGMTLLFFGIVFFRHLIVFLLSAEYAESVYLVALVCLPQILYALSETTTLGITFSRKSYLNIAVSVISIIPSIILNQILTPRLGGVGAAIASATAYVFFYSARTFFSSKSGFSFAVGKHYAVIIVMFITAVVNAFDFQQHFFINLGLFILALAIQVGTLKDSREIRLQPEAWNFD